VQGDRVLRDLFLSSLTWGGALGDWLVAGRCSCWCGVFAVSRLYEALAQGILVADCALS